MPQRRLFSIVSNFPDLTPYALPRPAGRTIEQILNGTCKQPYAANSEAATDALDAAAVTAFAADHEFDLQEAIRFIKAEKADAALCFLHLTVESTLDSGALNGQRGSVIFPAPFHQRPRLLVFAGAADAAAAKQAGADVVGGEGLVAGVLDGTVSYDKVLATPEMLSTVAKLARTLGPKGLMPSAKTGTLAADIGPAIAEALASCQFKMERGTACVSMPIGPVRKAVLSPR